MIVSLLLFAAWESGSVIPTAELTVASKLVSAGIGAASARLMRLSMSVQALTGAERYCAELPVSSEGYIGA